MSRNKGRTKPVPKGWNDWSIGKREKWLKHYRTSVQTKGITFTKGYLIPDAKWHEFKVHRLKKIVRWEHGC